MLLDCEEFVRLKLWPTTPFVGCGISENLDRDCVEKLRCDRGLGPPLDVVGAGALDSDVVDVSVGGKHGCRVVGGDFGR